MACPPLRFRSGGFVLWSCGETAVSSRLGVLRLRTVVKASIWGPNMNLETGEPVSFHPSLPFYGLVRHSYGSGAGVGVSGVF